ncbi:hypothetical protein ACFQH1_02355 [Lactiplantibacillus daoliensis]|uniref:Cell division protein n=1 Tax=Lactiplantibacillus daoliensis TaxID=2559916 RepID=A0ABW1UFM6_9LACO|nr:hypothetical protein [Lactiplantibacillus daoliensis]
MLKKGLRITRPYLIIVAISILMILPQIITRVPILGVDSSFHFNRIYEDAMQIKHWNFSYFQSNYGFSQSGRIINAVYGPIWSYALGFLMLIAGSVFKFQLAADLLLLIISGAGMYLFSRKSGANELFATIGTIMYLNVGWLPAWLTGQEFTAWGMMVMPFVLMMGIQMITDHEHPVNVLLLAISVAAIIQVHMLSALLVILALIPYFVIGMINAKNRLSMLVKTVVAAILAFLMSANIWAAMLNVTTGNHIIQPFGFPNMTGSSLNLSLGNSYMFTLGVVCSVLFIIQIFVALTVKGLPLTVYINTFVGAAFLIIGSQLFPWEQLAVRIPAIRSWLQFPARLGSIVGILLIAGMAGYLTQAVKQFDHIQSDWHRHFNWPTILFVLGAAILMIQNLKSMNVQIRQWYTNQPIQRMEHIYISKGTSATDIRNAFKGPDLSAGFAIVGKGTTDYLNQPAKYLTYNKKRDAYLDYIAQVVQKKDAYQKKVLSDGSLLVTWNAQKNGKKQIPIVSYSKSQITLNGNKKWDSHYQHSNIGALIVSQRKGKNTLIIKYRQGKTFTVFGMLALIVWIIVLLLLGLQSFNQHRLIRRVEAKL